MIMQLTALLHLLYQDIDEFYTTQTIKDSFNIFMVDLRHE